jgi:hypothetical protein
MPEPMSKSCVQKTGLVVQTLGLSSLVNHRDLKSNLGVEYKSAGFTHSGVKPGSIIRSAYPQLLGSLNRLACSFITNLHRPNKNYNYLNI